MCYNAYMQFVGNIPLWAFITIVVAASLFALFLITLIVSSIFVRVFKRQLKRNSDALNLLLSQRYEIVNEIIKLLKKHDIEVSDVDKKAVNKLERINDFQALLKSDRDLRVLSFIHSTHNIITICENNEVILKDPSYNEILIRFNDVEESYREKTALYNSEVYGFNYWINVPFVKYLYRLFKLRDKDLIV